MAPRAPQKRKKNQKKGIFGHWGPKWLTKKIFGDFQGGVSKSMLLLTERRLCIDVILNFKAFITNALSIKVCKLY